MILSSHWRKFLTERRAIAGALLIGMIMVTLFMLIASTIDPERFPSATLTITGVIAFTAGFLLLPDVDYRQQRTVAALLVLGLVMMWYAHQHGAQFRWVDVLARNTVLLSMLLSVSFLKLVTLPGDTTNMKSLPRGIKAFRNTLLSVALFGSVINISAPIVIADRLHSEKPLNFFAARSIVRVFTACACWSPFFAGTAVVLTYVDGVRLPLIVISGFPFLLVTVVLVYFLALRFDSKELGDFRGFPLQKGSLWVPVMLAIMVLLAYWWFPAFSILGSIACSAILLTVVTLLLRQGVGVTLKTLTHFVRTETPRSVNEVTLFLAAGVLATGLIGLVDIGVITPPLHSFTTVNAAQVLAAMTLISACGIHPVIQISGLTPILLVVNPPPTLLALTFLFAWSLGTCASPLSGTNLVFQGRYDVSALRLAVRNWGYVGMMYCVAVALLFLHAHLLGDYSS